MSEYASQQPEQLTNIDVQAACQLLDYDVQLDFSIPANVHDERRKICWEALQAREAMRHKLYMHAQKAGMEVNEEIAAAWDPSDNESHLEYLRKQLSGQRKRLSVIDGMAEFTLDQQELAEDIGVPLRPHQKEANEATYEFLVHAPSNEFGGKSGIIEKPTGTGKTAVFAKAVAQAKYGERPHEPIKVLVLVPTQDILEQTVGIGGERGFGKFAPHLDVGSFYQYAHELDHEVVVMTKASFNRLMDEGKMPHFDVVLVDEVHTFIADKTAAQLKEYCVDKIAIGYTATPEYYEGYSAYNLFDHQIYQMEFKDAVHDGLLAPVRGHLLDVEPKLELVKLPLGRNKRKRALRAARLQARTIETIEIIKTELERGVGVLVRCPAGDDIEFAATFANYLRDQLTNPDEFGNQRWINADFVGGSELRQDRETYKIIVESFNKGEGDVLTYVKKIGMGWDSPHAKALINLAPTTSSTEMRQAIGRLMRLTVGLDSKPIEARVYDFKDPDLGHKQYHCLHALKTKSGELINHERRDEDAPIPVPRRFRREAAPEVTQVSAVTIGEMALGHSANVTLPSNLEVSAVIARIQSETIPIDEASRILGVSLPTLRNILFNVGSSPNAPVPKSELLAIFELYPKLDVAPLPENGFKSLKKVSQMGKYYVRMLSLLPFAKNQGIPYYKFRSDEGVGYYFREEDVPLLLELVEQHPHLIRHYPRRN